MSRSARAVVNLSVEEFFAYPTPDGKAELVRGELRMSPPASLVHGLVISTIITRLGNYAAKHRAGRVFTDAGFELMELPRTVRAPDVAFIRMERLPADGVVTMTRRVAPDFVVEVLSPSETRARLREKLDDYRVSNIRLVWLVDPRARTVTVIEGENPVRRLEQRDRLDGGDVLPGFSCEIAELFDGLDA